ncbi:ketopantoate reductase family protein [Qiania dongpingensis]|uniref:2-dehydropantoate 2-reductase n=1 Tax=Qiania dongpingensis TaxID=2763669 RepID=A0A7G9G6L8_9FIRM|nr:ketopantoate reductase family protein [Qiania dongpingensis]QNM06450.1 ketopantoate reductase family protein [Qiania dongpingensis]
MRIQNVALIGLGAMGSFFAPRIEQYLGRQNFQVIASGKRKERLEKQGVTINGVNYRFTVRQPEEQGPKADLIIMAMKDMGLDQAIEDIRNLVGENTQILCVMNGIDSEERVAAAYGWEHVMYSYMRMSIVMKDGTADFDPYWGKVHFGEAKNEELTPRTERIRDFFENCDIPYQIDTDMKRGIWFKYMCNVGENLTCALLGIPFGAFRSSDSANAIRRGAMREVMAIANKKGIPLTEQDIEDQEATVRNIPFANKPSTLQDLEGKKKTEVEMFAGTVVRLGKELGVPTPISWMFYHGIKVYEEKNEGKFEIE